MKCTTHQLYIKMALAMSACGFADKSKSLGKQSSLSHHSLTDRVTFRLWRPVPHHPCYSTHLRAIILKLAAASFLQPDRWNQTDFLLTNQNRKLPRPVHKVVYEKARVILPHAQTLQQLRHRYIYEFCQSIGSDLVPMASLHCKAVEII